jgi:hypothetical protein
MLRQLLVSCVVAICLVTSYSQSYGQIQSVRPYFGFNGGLTVDGDPGWGVEAGMQYVSFYAGLEYGVSYLLPTVVNYDIDGAVPADRSLSNEQFFGVHAGYIFPRDSANHNSICLGVVILKGSQSWGRYDNVSGWITFTKSYLNIGPDFRVSSINDGHIYIDLAITILRSGQIGVGYMF